MQKYNAMVRPNGAVTCEVYKTDLTAAEIGVLRALHGNDAVVKVESQELHNDKTSHKGERERLIGVYGPKVIRQLFGPPHLNLPVELAEVETMAPIEDEDDAEKAAA